jgi:hypothetical protein
MQLTSLFSSSIEDDVRSAKHMGIHNFSYGTLETYFRITNARTAVDFEDNILVLRKLPGTVSTKTWVFGEGPFDMDKLEALQREGPVYSQYEIDLEKGSQFRELAYNLNEVFDPASYPNSKKRNQRIKYPFAFFHRGHWELREGASLSDIKALHDSWRDKKLKDPKVFQIMFPNKRYLQCAEFALKRPDLYKMLAAYSAEGKLVAVRVLYIDGTSAFDLANFAANWDLPSNFTEYFGTVTMGNLRDSGIELVNCGASLNKHLSQFKSHWPSTYVVSYIYSRIKEAA